MLALLLLPLFYLAIMAICDALIPIKRCNYMSVVNLSRKLEPMLLLPEKGNLTTFQEAVGRCYSDEWNGKPASYQSMMFGESIVKVKCTRPDLYDIIKECETIHADKKRKYNQLPSYPKQLSFIEMPRHNTWGLGLEHDFDDEPIYKDCLCGIDWLKEHKDFEMPEPLIEITFDGGKSISVNGNYKKGMIGEFVKGLYVKSKGFVFYKDTGERVPTKEHPIYMC